VRTIAGNGGRGYAGDGGLAVDGTLGRPHGVAVAPDGTLYIGDTEGYCIRKVARPG
jgi:glucose/arabinose dehydrogenase